MPKPLPQKRQRRIVPNMNAPQSVADQLRDAIRKDGRPLLQIARKADVAQSMLHRFMNDPSKTVTLETAHALAIALQIRLMIGK